MTAAHRAIPNAGRVLANVLFNWSGQFLAVGIAFFLAPFVVHHLGNANYGVWTLTRSVAGYLALMDLGVRGAVTRYSAKFFAQADHDGINRLAGSALGIFMVFGAAAVLLSLGVAVGGLQYFNIPSEYLAAARLVLAMAGVTVAVTLVGGLYGGILAGLQRFDILNAVDLLLGIGNALGIFIVLAHGEGIVAMAEVQLLVAVIRTVALAFFAQRLYPTLRARPTLANRDATRMIFSFSLFAFAMQVSGNLIYYSDAAVIAAFLPVSVLVFFAIGGSLVEYTRMLVSGVSQVMSPLASTLDAQSDRPRLQALVLESATFSVMVVLPIAVTFLIRGRSFIGLWMGPSYAPLAGTVLAVLTLPLLLHGGAYGLGGILLGVGKHKPLAPLMIAEGLCNIGLSIVLVQRMGLVGVAWGTTIPNLATSLLFWPWYIHRTFGVTPGRYVATIWVRPALAIMPFAIGTYGMERIWPATTLVEFMMQVAVCTPLALVAFWALCLTELQRQRMIEILRLRLIGRR